MILPKLLPAPPFIRQIRVWMKCKVLLAFFCRWWLYGFSSSSSSSIQFYINLLLWEPEGCPSPWNRGGQQSTSVSLSHKGLLRGKVSFRSWPCFWCPFSNWPYQEDQLSPSHGGGCHPSHTRTMSSWVCLWFSHLVRPSLWPCGCNQMSALHAHTTWGVDWTTLRQCLQDRAWRAAAHRRSCPGAWHHRSTEPLLCHYGANAAGLCSLAPRSHCHEA